MFVHVLRLGRYLLHPRLRDAPDAERRQALVVGGVALFAFAVALSFLAYFLTAERSRDAAVVAALALGLTAVPVALRVVGSLAAGRAALVTVVFLVVTATNLLSGGARSHAHYLYGMVPVIAVVLSGVRASTRWMLASVAALLGMYGLEAAGVALPPWYGSHALAVDLPVLALGTAPIFLISAAIAANRRAVRARAARAAAKAAVASVERRAAHAQLRQADAIKALFLHRTGEGFAPSVGALVARAEALRSRLPPHLHEHGEMLANAADALQDKLQRFVAYTRRAPRFDERPVAFDLAAVLDGLGRSLEARAALRGLRFDLTLPAGVAAHRVGHPARTEMVLRALVDNAIEFTPEGGVRLDVVELDADRLRFDVHDTGVGVMEPHRARIFEPFFQADSGTTRRHEGAGLGLAMARAMARGLGGELTYEGAAAGGSCFSFELPLPVAERPAAPAVEAVA